MKHFFAVLMILAAVMTGYAQTSDKMTTTRIIRGAVIDKNGNPLPGATVKATGGAETVVTDADGTYTIEVPLWLKSLTASYPGLGETKMKTTAYDQMIIMLKSRYRTYGFINLVGQVRTTIGSESYGEKIPMPAFGEIGIMGGAYRSWGGYVKCVMRVAGSRPKNSGNLEWYEGYSWDYLPSVTGGVIKRINNNFNIFVGVGVSNNYGVYAYHNYEEVYDPSTGTWDYTQSGIMNCETTEEGVLSAELGGMWKFSRKLNATFGLTYIGGDGWLSNSGQLGFWLGVGLNI